MFEKDELHARAQAIAAQITGPMYTSTWVLVEVADALATPGRREKFLPLLRFLRANPQVTILPPDPEIFERGTVMFHQRRDKAWSLTDCISFLIMHDRGLRDALTGDHHFEQAGFNALMK